jgi:hypothetical protein
MVLNINVNVNVVINMTIKITIAITITTKQTLTPTMPHSLPKSSYPTALHPTPAGLLLPIVKPWLALDTLHTLVSRNFLAITEEHPESTGLNGRYTHFIVCAVRICNGRAGAEVHYVQWNVPPKSTSTRRTAASKHAHKPTTATRHRKSTIIQHAY